MFVLCQDSAKIRNKLIREKNLSVVYANDAVLRDVFLTDYFSSGSISSRFVSPRSLPHTTLGGG